MIALTACLALVVAVPDAEVIKIGSYHGATGEYSRPYGPDDHEAVTPANVVWGMVKGGAVVLADTNMPSR